MPVAAFGSEAGFCDAWTVVRFRPAGLEDFDACGDLLPPFTGGVADNMRAQLQRDLLAIADIHVNAASAFFESLCSLPERDLRAWAAAYSGPGARFVHVVPQDGGYVLLDEADFEQQVGPGWVSPHFELWTFQLGTNKRFRTPAAARRAARSAQKRSDAGDEYDDDCIYFPWPEAALDLL